MAGQTFNSIGDFYQAIRDAFTTLNPTLAVDRQLSRNSGRIKFAPMDTLDKVTAAIDLLMLQGEGSLATPKETPGDLAHYYRFGEIYHGKKLIKDPATGKWSFDGGPVPLPDTWNMADIPAGGYRQADVPDATIWDQIVQFDQAYSDVLRKLQSAWTHGNAGDLTAAIGSMFAMNQIGNDLIQKPRPDGLGNYGPCFRFVS